MAQALEKAYAKYNRKFFSGELPDIPVRWSNIVRSDTWVKAYGWFHPEIGPEGTISISSELKKHWCLWRMTLLHEMAHVKLQDNPDEIKSSSTKHSKAWQKEMKRLAAAGAFDELW